MPKYLVHDGAEVICIHSPGLATPTATNPRVKVDDKATVFMVSPYKVTGCSLPTTSGGPCLSANWTSGTTRVKANGQALVFFDSESRTNTATPLKIKNTQKRVSAE